MKIRNGVHMIEDIGEEEYQQVSDILLDKNGNIQAVPAKSLAGIPQINLSLWGRRHGIYGYVTTELIDWLRNEIGEKTAIEIGAGQNIIGKELGIPQTDSYLQTRPEIIAHYKKCDCPVIQYPEWVHKLEAKKACLKFKPQVVIGSWMTQLGDINTPDSNVYGVNDSWILNHVDKYIHIGHRQNHNGKKILSDHHHKFYDFDWLYSRAFEPEYNRIWVWEPGNA